jgi:type IV pilus biogenesis protein PilP
VAVQAAKQAAEQDLADAVANDVASAVANNPPPVITGTKLAVARSRVPSSRPSNIASLADRANKQTEARSAALIPASVAPNKAPTEEETADEPELASVAPRIPSSASVTRQATVTKAIKLNKVNLIGVFGTPSQRRALVRLPNGKFVKLKVGDRVDGGKVAAIGTAELRYVKSGRNVVLTMPKG